MMNQVETLPFETEYVRFRRDAFTRVWGEWRMECVCMYVYDKNFISSSVKPTLE